MLENSLEKGKKGEKGEKGGESGRKAGQHILGFWDPKTWPKASYIIQQ